MRASELLEYALANTRELEPLVISAGYLHNDDGGPSWFSDWGVELDLEHLIELGIVKIDEESKMSIYMPVHLLVCYKIDLRNYTIDVDNPTVEDGQLISIVHPNEVGQVRGLDLFGYKRMTNAYDKPSDGYF